MWKDEHGNPFHQQEYMDLVSKNNEYGYDDNKLMSLFVDFKIAVA
jgi:hypothetical protein